MSTAELDKQPQVVAGMFDSVAGRYDLMNDVLSLGRDRAWRRETFAAVDAVPGDTVLDLAAGTGTSTRDYLDIGARVVPCDFSLGMVREGKVRVPELPFVAGDALHLPFADASFDAVTISFGLRNVADVERALGEMLRVTVPGGKIVICEFSTPTWRPFATVYGQYLVRALPTVARALTPNPDAYVYLADSIRAWPDQRALGRAMRRCGWREVAYRNLSGGIVALHRGIRPID